MIARRYLPLMLVVGLLVPLLAQPVTARAQGDGLDAAALDGYAEGVSREYAPPLLVGNLAPVFETWRGPIALVIEVSRFVDTGTARDAYAALIADRDTSVERLFASEGTTTSNRRSDDIGALGDVASAISFDVSGFLPDGVTLQVGYLVVRSGDLVFEMYALGIGPETLGLASDVAEVMVMREVGAGDEEVPWYQGSGGLFDLFPEGNDPVLAGLVVNGSDRYLQPDDAAA